MKVEHAQLLPALSIQFFRAKTTALIDNCSGWMMETGPSKGQTDRCSIWWSKHLSLSNGTKMTRPFSSLGLSNFDNQCFLDPFIYVPEPRDQTANLCLVFWFANVFSRTQGCEACDAESNMRRGKEIVAFFFFFAKCNVGSI